MPSAVALSSTIALTSVTYPFGLGIADTGAEQALRDSDSLARGVNIYKGHCTHRGVAESLGLEYTELGELL